MHCPCEPERCRREMVLWAEGWAGRTLHGNSPSYNSTHPSRQRGRWPTQSHPVLGNDTGMGSALLVAGFQSGMNGKPWHRRSRKQRALHFTSSYKLGEKPTQNRGRNTPGYPISPSSASSLGYSQCVKLERSRVPRRWAGWSRSSGVALLPFPLPWPPSPFPPALLPTAHCPQRDWP